MHFSFVFPMLLQISRVYLTPPLQLVILHGTDVEESFMTDTKWAE